MSRKLGTFHKMTLKEFLEQDEYCKENNHPEGCGCCGCPGEGLDFCADALTNVMDDVKLEYWDVDEELVRQRGRENAQVCVDEAMKLLQNLGRGYSR
jgi:hypothetical protein